MTRQNESVLTLARHLISDGLVRVSVGIENVEDLIRDFDAALG